MIYLQYIVFIIISLYALTILIFTFGWYRIKIYKIQSNYPNIPVSIVVACRNEASNITCLLKSLIDQNYSKKYTEILIIDDHSTDETVRIINNFIASLDYIKLLQVPKNSTGKKAAIQFGIENARSEIIITTDADCFMRKDWLSSLVSYYVQNKPKMLVGPVCFTKEKTTFKNLQSVEFLSLIGSGAGAIGINRPIMNNGANLLFEKSIYLEANMQSNYISGDDVFLLLHIKKTHKNAIQFIKSKEAIVYTKSEETVHSFFNQRIRWTSKSKAYKDFDVIFTSLIVAITSLSIISSLTYSIFNFYFLYSFIIIFVVKSISDFILLVPILKFFERSKLIWLSIPLQIIYPFYIIFTVFLGLIGNFNWKGRKYQEKR